MTNQDTNEEGLDWWLKAPLGLRETADERAGRLMAATRSMSEKERVAAIVHIIVPKTKLKKPKNKPGILYDFIPYHDDWIPCFASKGGLAFAAVTDNELSYYRQLFNEMSARGGNLKAARMIVRLQYLTMSGWVGRAGRGGEKRIRSIWYVPVEKEREAAAKKMLRFYRNRRRILPKISAQRGPWLILADGLSKMSAAIPLKRPPKVSSAARAEHQRRLKASLRCFGVAPIVCSNSNKPATK